MKKDIILEVRNLSKSYDDGECGHEVLKGLNLELEKKEFLCILGPSGCGKTTFLRCVAGFESYEGEILVNGKVCKEPGADRLMVFQTFDQLFPWKSVEENIKYPLRLKGIKNGRELDEITDSVLKKVGLPDVKKSYPHQLSGGMKQRVAIAKALALKSEIILMDEPFAALDAISRNNLQAEMAKIFSNEDSTFIFITHNIQESLTLGSRIMVLKEGGEIAVDIKNPLKKPVSPSSEGYGKLWQELHDSLYV